jgi:hypothetical protein
MSETVVYTGKLMKVDKLDTETPETWCKEYCQQNGVSELDKYYKTWVECFSDEFYDDFIVHKNDIYRIINRTRIGENDIFYAKKDDRGCIDFVLSYYNGGCGFSEAIEEALDNLQ